MAVFYLGMKTFSRGHGRRGSRSTSAAAYRSGERIRDERTGHTYDHRRRTDVMHKEIVLPARLAAQRASLEWARDRGKLWNAAEHAEPRRNARVAREFILALPHELSPPARTQLARRFAQDIADRYGSAVDLAIHAPRGDARNFHAHLLSTTREITPDGLGPKTTLELNGTRRHELGLPRWREEIASLRGHWAALTNQALEREHIAARISHLSRTERGPAAAAQPPRVPIVAYHMERRGERSLIGERIRERYRAMLEQASDKNVAQALERSVPDRRVALARGRTLVAFGRTAMRQLSAGVAAAWRAVRDRLGEPPAVGKASGLEQSSRARETTVQLPANAAGDSRAASDARLQTPGREIRSREGQLDVVPAASQRHGIDWADVSSRNVPTLDEMRARFAKEGWRVSDADIESVRNWLIRRDEVRSRAAAELREPQVEAASESRARRHGQGFRTRHEHQHGRAHEDEQGQGHGYGHEDRQEREHEASRRHGKDFGFGL